MSKKYDKPYLLSLNFSEEEIKHYLRANDSRSSQFFISLIEREVERRAEEQTADIVKKALTQPQQTQQTQPQQPTPQPIQLNQQPASSGGPNVDDQSFASALAQYQSLLPRPTQMMWRGNLYSVADTPTTDNPTNIPNKEMPLAITTKSWGQSINPATNPDAQTTSSQDVPIPDKQNKIWGNSEVLAKLI